MNPGDLRERVTFQRLSGKTWSNLASNPTVWAAVEAQGNGTYRIHIRYRSDLRAIADAPPGSNRVLWRNLTLDVTDVIEVVPHREVSVIAQQRLIESNNLATGAKHRQPWPSA